MIGMDLEKICQKIIKLDSKIRSARIISKKGKLLAGGMKKGKQSLEDAKRDEMLFMELALRVRMRGEFDEEFGKTRFSLSYRDKILIMSFPMDENVAFISAEKKIDIGVIPFKILKIIKSKI